MKVKERVLKSVIGTKAPYKDFCPKEYPGQIWNSREDGTLEVGSYNDEPSLTQQQFADECDVNNILKSYSEIGHFASNPNSKLIYGDFSQIPDLQGAIHLVNSANEAFAGLPAKVRSRFNNDPAQLVEFCKDPNNLNEAIQLGLADQPVNANDDKTTNATKPVDTTKTV